MGDKHSLKKLSKLSWLVPAVCVMLAGGQAKAIVGPPPTTTNTIVRPSTPVFDSNHVVGVNSDAAPGFNDGSFASDGVAKTDMYFTPESLFGHAVNIGDVKSMSYWTKKGTTHSVNLVDWAFSVYTKPYSGDVSTPAWYGDRIGSEPYFARNTNDPANTWNKWSSDGAQNQMIFYESTEGAPGANFGSSSDPDWASLKTSNALSGLPYANHEILAFSMQTGSGTAAGFTGQVDGITITLNDDSVAKINFEPNDTTAPAVPVHVSPADHSVRTVAAQIKIDWTDVTDPSGPVTYLYQSSMSPATNPDGSFVSPAYTSGALTVSEIPTPGTPPGVYFWHVKAVDGVGNASAWSNPWKVTVVALLAPSTQKDCDGDNWKMFNNPVFKNRGKCRDYVWDHSKVVSGEVKYTAFSVKRKAEFEMNTAQNKGKFEYSDDNHAWYDAKISSVKVSGKDAWFTGEVKHASDPSWVGKWVFVKVTDGNPDKIWGDFMSKTDALNGVSDMTNPASGPFNVTSGQLKIK